MISLKKNLLGLGLLAGLIPVAMAAEDAETTADTSRDARVWVEANLENMIQGKLPSFEGMSCEYEACAEGCTAECQEKTTAWMAKMQKNPTAYYASLFAKKPELWAAVGPTVERRYGEKRTTMDERGRILDLVSEVPAALKSELPVALWNVDADGFTTDHLITFASAKAGKCFVKSLARQVEQSNAAYAGADIRPALFFAMRGDDRGKPTLVRTIKKTRLQEGSAIAVLLAAQGLEILGKEGCLQSQQERVFEATIAALDDENLELARLLTVQAQRFADSTKKGKKGYGWGWRSALASSCEVDAEEARTLASADQILKAIETVTPL